MVSEKDILKRLEEGGISLPPLDIRLYGESVAGDMEVDAVIQVSWGRQREKFAVEVRAQFTPRVLNEATNRARAAAKKVGLNPMIILPYLSDDALGKLHIEGVSGIDLCGNGIVVVSGRMSVYRTGNPNRFPSSAPIKNIYRKNTSMVARLFLVRQRFNLVGEIMEEINERNLLATWGKQSITFPTVSKALKGLEEDLIVGRKNSFVSLLQAEKLLDILSQNYSEPKIGKIVNWKVPASPGERYSSDLLPAAFLNSIPAVIAGTSSVSRYAVMQAADTLRIYCPDPERWLEKLPGAPSDRFPTISVIETEDASVFFDARREEGIAWASPVQTYLELMKGDKRDKETAIQVKDLILRRLREDPL